MWFKKKKKDGALYQVTLTMGGGGSERGRLMNHIYSIIWMILPTQLGSPFLYFTDSFYQQWHTEGGTLLKCTFVFFFYIALYNGSCCCSITFLIKAG